MLHWPPEAHPSVHLCRPAHAAQLCTAGAAAIQNCREDPSMSADPADSSVGRALLVALAHQAALRPFQALAQALVDNPSGSLAAPGGEALSMLRCRPLVTCRRCRRHRATAAADATAGFPNIRTTRSFTSFMLVLLCYRARKSGWFVPAASATHSSGGATAPTRSRRGSWRRATARAALV